MPSLSLLKKLSNQVALLKDKKDQLYLQFVDSEITIKVKTGGYIPRSGLLFIDYLSQIPLQGSVLDLGTGETGILAHYAYNREAKRIVGIDLDQSAIKHAQKSTITPTLIEWYYGDLFEPLQKKIDRFDYILTNPPQMPTTKWKTIPFMF